MLQLHPVIVLPEVLAARLHPRMVSTVASPSRLVQRTPVWSALSARTQDGLRSIVGGQRDLPAWVLALADGDDEGYFGPGSATWRVHRDLCLLVGGLRALMLQMLHPGAVAGVDAHSTYRENGLARLARTNRWIMVTTFGSRAAANREALRVRSMHKKVRGTYLDASGQTRGYRADDGRLLAWVHIAFTDSCLSSFRHFSADPMRWDRGLADDYVAEWAVAGELVGVTDPPRSRIDLGHALLDFEPELAWTPAADQVLHFLRNPPLPTSMWPAYQALFHGAAATLAPDHRSLIPLTTRGEALPRQAAKMMVGTLRTLTAADSPGLVQAELRLARLADERLGEGEGAPPGCGPQGTLAARCRPGSRNTQRRENRHPTTRRPPGRL